MGTHTDAKALSWPADGSEEDIQLQREYDAFLAWQKSEGVNCELTLFAQDREQRERAMSVDDAIDEAAYGA